MLTLPKLQQNLVKQPLKIQTNLKESEIMKWNLSVFLDTKEVIDFRWKNADVCRTQGVCHVIYIYFGSSLGKV